MTPLARERLQLAGEWLLVFFLVASTGLLSKLFTRAGIGVSTLWVANGLLVRYLLHVPRSR